jgi:hypothetical protein
MKGKNLAVIVAALRPGSGTTLLARLFADYAILSREHPLIFDTDSIDCKLSRYFPRSARRVDLDRVQGQMSLFDTLASATRGTCVVDVTHRRMKKFFDLMHEIDYVAEARARQVEPAIFYIVRSDFESYEHGQKLRNRFDCPFVVVENAFLAEPKPNLHLSNGFAALTQHPLRMQMASCVGPRLAEMMADPHVSFSDVIRQDRDAPPLADLTHQQRAAIRGWIMKMFKEIHRLTHGLKAPVSVPASGEGKA